MFDKRVSSCFFYVNSKLMYAVPLLQYYFYSIVAKQCNKAGYILFDVLFYYVVKKGIFI